MLRKVLIALGVLLVIVVIGLVAMVRELSKADQIMASVEVNPDGIAEIVATLPDGDYEGEFHPGKFVGASVRVSIINHRIVGIKILEHNNMRGKPAEQLTEVVVSKQSLAVDSISGATASSKVLLVAIEQAIRGSK